MLTIRLVDDATVTCTIYELSKELLRIGIHAFILNKSRCNTLGLTILQTKYGKTLAIILA